MGCNDHIDFERYDDIQQLVAEGTLEKGTPAYVIARQTIDLGFATLSKRQHYIYDMVIAPALEALAQEQSINARCNNAPTDTTANDNPLPAQASLAPDAATGTW